MYKDKIYVKQNQCCLSDSELQGPHGPSGPKGNRGPRGIIGPKGHPGKLVIPGFSGTFNIIGLPEDSFTIGSDTYNGNYRTQNAGITITAQQNVLYSQIYNIITLSGFFQYKIVGDGTSSGGQINLDIPDININTITTGNLPITVTPFDSNGVNDIIYEVVATTSTVIAIAFRNRNPNTPFLSGTINVAWSGQIQLV